MEIGIVKATDAISDKDVAFIAEACSQQAEEFCAAWGLPVVPVSFYVRGAAPSESVSHAFVIVDTIEPGMLGMHTEWAGIPNAEVLLQDVAGTSSTCSHEVLEMIGDPLCNLWAPYTNGRRQAREAADRVEADVYYEPVTILGETRSMPVSNYLLPSAFVTDGAGPWDRMGRLTSWDGMTPGGYCIVQDAAGNVANVFADRVPETFARKLANPNSRTLQRLRTRAA